MAIVPTEPWCGPDDCPVTICGGPHVSHRCPNGDEVTMRADSTDPCPFCGWKAGEPKVGERTFYRWKYAEEAAQDLVREKVPFKLYPRYDVTYEEDGESYTHDIFVLETTDVPG